MMTRGAYEFLVGRGNKREFEYCRNFGYCVGVDLSGRPIMTGKGVSAVRAYQSSENYNKVDVI